jgi:hypothetical protein
MTTAAPARALVGSYTMNGHGGAGCSGGLPDCESDTSPGITVAAGTKALAWRAEIVMPRRRPSEDEIVRAAITVILVALGTIIALAATAILTMG